ncbi:MAG: 3-deoxy-manno-octulosonate cytidylyltransferase [Myxococcota bacterium]
MRVAAIIPARYASTRFPGKPLVPILGRPMILHVAERVQEACEAGIVDRVLVATDDERIAKVVREAGHEVRMTSPAHPTGTDRLAEVASSLEEPLICNVQGDEPLIEPDTIAALLEPMRADPSLPMATLKTALDRPEDLFDPNRGKVVVDVAGRALTFTRLPIVDYVGPLQDYFNRERVEREHREGGAVVFSDIGIYAYRREMLLRYPSLERTPFERRERLEQLRALEHGYPIAVPTVRHRALEVDTPEDLARVEAALRSPSH